MPPDARSADVTHSRAVSVRARLLGLSERRTLTTEPKCVEAFAGAPVFVFHGCRDNSAPFADAERMVAALRQAGARVTFVIEDDAGHDIPGAQTPMTYSDWTHSVLGRLRGRCNGPLARCLCHASVRPRIQRTGRP